MCSKYIKSHAPRDMFQIIAAIDFFYFQHLIRFARVPTKQSRSRSVKIECQALPPR